MAIIILFGIIALALFKAFIRYMEYGKNVFDVFKKVDVNTRETNLQSILNMLNIYKKVITNNFYSDYIVVCKCGIILIKILKEQGTLCGEQEHPNIELKRGFSYSETIENPFNKLRQEKNKIRALVNCHVTEVIIKTDTTKIDVEYDSSTIVSTMAQLYYKLEGITKRGSYTDLEVDEIYKKLVM